MKTYTIGGSTFKCISGQHRNSFDLILKFDQNALIVLACLLVSEGVHCTIDS